jgi:predicted esterase
MNMRSLFLFLVLFLGLFSACRKRNGSDDIQKPATYDSTPSPFMQRTLVELDAYHKDSALLQLPEHYNSGFDTEKYPLVIFLNGRFEGSDYGNLNKLLKWGVPKFMADSVRFAFNVGGKTQGMIMLSPQSANGYPSPVAINQVIDYMLTRYRVDLSRIYLTGLSSGAAAVFSYLTYSKEYAARLAAAVPMSSIELETGKIANLKYISDAGTHVNIFCGIYDDLYLKNKRYADEINSYTPGLAVFTSYGGAHNSWNGRFNPLQSSPTQNIYQWMLQYHK